MERRGKLEEGDDVGSGILERRCGMDGVVQKQASYVEHGLVKSLESKKSNEHMQKCARSWEKEKAWSRGRGCALVAGIGRRWWRW